MENLTVISWVVDFGLLVLIWLVQLIIYPSLCAFSSDEALWKWHSIYTKRIAYIVIPLMIGQVILWSLQLFDGFTIYIAIRGFLILIVWVVTFTIFVPLHQKIANKIKMQQNARALVLKNGWRTCIWTLLFLIHLFEVIS